MYPCEQGYSVKINYLLIYRFLDIHLNNKILEKCFLIIETKSVNQAMTCVQSAEYYFSHIFECQNTLFIRKTGRLALKSGYLYHL